MILKPHLLTEVSDANIKDHGTILDDQTAGPTGNEAFSFNKIVGTDQPDSSRTPGFRGTDEDDLIYALGGKDRVFAGEGNDIVYGGDGGDQLQGGADNDVLNGGKGNDVLVGDFWSWGADPDPGAMYADFFVFDVANWGNDTIMDFDDNLDKIVFGGTSGVNDFSDLEIKGYINPNTGDFYTKITFDDGIGESSIRLLNFNGTIDQNDFIF